MGKSQIPCDLCAKLRNPDPRCKSVTIEITATFQKCGTTPNY